MQIAKAHAYGNDFLYVRQAELGPDRDVVADARRLCARRTGMGADGLIVWEDTTAGASMRLINPDGSHAEVSGNGVRGLGAILVRERGLDVGRTLEIVTDAGMKRLTLEGRPDDARYTFRAEMGRPVGIRQEALTVDGDAVTLAVMSMGNPQAVALERLDGARLGRLGRALQTHDAFPEGVNLELAEVVAPDLVRILIFERGVGPTESSGTGSCAAAVAAASFGGSARSVIVEAPGGAQRVEWRDDGEVVLTGWAEVVFEGRWVGPGA